MFLSKNLICCIIFLSMCSFLMSNQLLRSNHGHEYTIAEQNQVKWTFDDGPKVRSLSSIQLPLPSLQSLNSVTCFFYASNNCPFCLLKGKKCFNCTSSFSTCLEYDVYIYFLSLRGHLIKHGTISVHLYVYLVGVFGYQVYWSSTEIVRK